MPCLAALYALLYGDATSACMEPVLMMRPQPPASMPGSAALVVWKAEVRHTAIMASHLRRRPRVAAAPRPRRPARLARAAGCAARCCRSCHAKRAE